jgi:ATP-dependent DNA helicase RecQ
VPEPLGPCCDVCDPGLAPEPPAAPARRAAPAGPRQLAQRPVAHGDLAGLDEAILETVAAAQPEVGRTRAVEVLRGGRSKVVAKYSYDGLPHYGAYGHLRAEAVLERVDALLTAGTLRSTGGRFPKLEVV